MTAAARAVSVNDLIAIGFGDTKIESGAFVTLTVIVSCAASRVTLMTAEPTAIALTSPVTLSTWAICGALEFQLLIEPLVPTLDPIELPRASFTIALSDVLFPGAVRTTGWAPRMLTEVASWCMMTLKFDVSGTLAAVKPIPITLTESALSTAVITPVCGLTSTWAGLVG